MKYKLILASLIFSLSLTACAKKDKNNEANKSTENTSQEISNNLEDKQEIPDIIIFTKDGDIVYEKDVEEVDKFLENYKLTKLDENEKIRISFKNNIPEKINLYKIYYGNGVEVKETEVEEIKVSKDGFVDFIHTYNKDNDKLDTIIYEVISLDKDENIIGKYSFAFEITPRKYLKDFDNDKNVDTPNVNVNYLSQGEQEIYDNYKQDKNIKKLENIEPIVIAKFYAQALIEENYDLAYSFFSDKNEKPTKEEFEKIIKSLDKDIKADYIKNIKAVENGEFLEETKSSGYIQYELIENHPLALDVSKNNNIWQLDYLPIQ